MLFARLVDASSPHLALVLLANAIPSAFLFGPESALWSNNHIHSPTPQCAHHTQQQQQQQQRTTTQTIPRRMFLETYAV
jgi:hypothetical protein